MKKLLFFSLLVLMITMNIKGYSQTWDKKNIEKREFEILYKTCKLGQGIDQNDFTDLFVNGLIEEMIKNIKDTKNMEQIKMIIDNSRSYFDLKCASYIAKVDSAHKAYILNIKADSVVMPENGKRD